METKRRTTSTCVAYVLNGLAILFATLPQPAHAQADDIAGSRYAGAFDWVYLADYPIAIWGTVLKVKYYECTAFCDGDLNVFIMPDPAFAWVARNPRHANALNQPLEDGEIPAGAIEAEVKTVKGIVENRFPPGTHVLIEGWWVEDAGHPIHKTELHPIRYMLANPAGQSEKSVIFMAQDFSGRFDAGGWDHSQFFHFGLPLADMIQGEKASGVSDAAVLIETSELDFLSHDPFDTGAPVQRSGYNLSFSQLEDPPEFRVNVLQHPTSFPYLPFYSSLVERLSKPVYRDAVAYSVTNNNAGQKYVLVSINAELLGTGTDQGLLVSYWIAETEPGKQPETKAIVNSPHVFSFTREYGPAIGKTATSWMLQATGSSQGVNVPSNTADQGLGTRASVLKQREYRIEPSWLGLLFAGPRQTLSRAQLEREHPEGPALDLVGQAMYCQWDTAVTAVEHLLPEVSVLPGAFRWSVRVPDVVSPIQAAVNVSMRAILPTQGEWKAVTADAPFENDAVKVTVDPTNDHRLVFRWKALGYLDVKATGSSTDLGERLEATGRAANFCAVSAGLGGLDHFIESIIKGLLAIDRLRQLGRLPDVIPPDLSRFLGRVRFGTVPEPYQLVSRLPGPYRDVLGASVKFFDQQPLTIREWNLLNRFAAAASPIRWSTRPPLGVFTPRPQPQEHARANLPPEGQIKHSSAVVIPWRGSPLPMQQAPRSPPR